MDDPQKANEDDVLVGAETTKACPACQAMLSDGTIENRPVLYCAKCRGLLVSIDKFLPLVEYMRTVWHSTGTNIEPRDSADADRHLSCPQCSKIMIGYPYGGPGNVNLDSCERCSVIWLDRNELRRIVLAPDHTSLYSKGDYGGGIQR